MAAFRVYFGYFIELRKTVKDQSVILPLDIDQYMEMLDNNVPVAIQGLDDLLESVSNKLSSNKDAIKIITRLFFQEIRHSLLQGKKICLRNLGSFVISSPKSGNKTRVFVKFKPSKQIVRRLNARQ